MVGVARSTWQYRSSPRPAVLAPVHQSDRAYESRISTAEREQIYAHILRSWADGNSVDHAFATAWDQGIMLASQRSWWRIAQELEQQDQRPVTPTKKRPGTRVRREAPVLKATGPGQVWSWDITEIYSIWNGVRFKVYSITDIYSRQIVGWRVEEREADHLAVEMFHTAIALHGAPGVVHVDSGPAMRSHALRDALSAHGVELSFIRPSVSNDNPYSESAFKTMKYRPNYPRVFHTLEAAREYLTGYVHWYSTEHKHSGIALFSPAQVHNGTWKDLWSIRDQAHQAYYKKHPARFHRPPTTPAPANCVGINLPQQQKQQKQAQ